MKRPLRIILGGTFDPVHHGHLRCALEVAEWARGPVHMLLSAHPGHRRRPVASARQRWKMLEDACAGHPQLIPDARELHRAGPSYSVDTLSELRALEPAAAIVFVIGADAFAGLTGWHQWRRLLELTHFLVVHRPGHRLRPPDELAPWWASNRCRALEQLRSEAAGRAMELEITPLEISASMIRERIAGGGDPAFLLPEAVRETILETGLYRRQEPASEP